MSTWFVETRQTYLHLLEEIKAMPFIQELISGSLPRETFNFYIQQDALYLAQYKKVLALVGTHCLDPHDTQFYLESATGIIDVERELHEKYMDGNLEGVEPSPTCELYVSYLTKMSCTESRQEAVAAVLPCFTVYQEIGDYIQEQQTAGSNPYQDWIDTYGGEAFAQAVRQAIDITNRCADQASSEVRNRMAAAFEKSTKLEWMFWDSAYNKEQWKI